MRESAHIQIYCLLRDQLGHVKPVEKEMAGRANFIYDASWQPEPLLGAHPDVVLCVNDFHFDVARCLRAAREARIPSLVLQDGILEWRCQYENPKFASGEGAPQHQPVLADKIACMGPQSARQLLRWNTPDKIEVTGMPRMDALLSWGFPPVQRPARRILVMTAKKPGFTREQMEIAARSLHDLKGYFERLPGVEVVWRVTKGLERELGVINRLRVTESKELAAILAQVDAVITTPSTAMVEAMLAKRPTALLDYHNVPHFGNSAWRISCPNQIAPVVEEILNPPDRKMEFQNDCLEDLLVCDLAAPKVARLLSAMAACGQRARLEGSALELPVNMADYNFFSKTAFSDKPSLAMLYPNRHAFWEENITELQALLARAEGEVEELRRQLQRRRIGYWLERVVRKLWLAGKAGRWLGRRDGKR